MIKRVNILLLIVVFSQVLILFVTITKEIKNKEIEENSITYFLNTKINKTVKIDDIIKYEMIIEIPKINIKKGILKKEDKDNNIDKNVTILKESNYPNEDGNIYIAAHSGNGKHSYFNNLGKLKENDVTYLYYKNIKYIYNVKEIKSISKISNTSILTKEKNSLILITCNQKDKTKYLIVILEQTKKQNYK